MLNAADLPDTSPIFPMPCVLMLPRARLPLHVFEPRYLSMLNDTLKTSHRLIGMIQPCDVPEKEPPRLHRIGCAGRVTAFSETGDGRYMITLTGISRYRVVEETEGFIPYRRVEASWTGFDRDLGETEDDSGFNRNHLFDLLNRYFKANKLSSDWESLRTAESELLINYLSMLCPFGAEEKQALLEAPTLPERRETLMKLLEFGLRGGAGEETVQ